MSETISIDGHKLNFFICEDIQYAVINDGSKFDGGKYTIIDYNSIYLPKGTELSGRVLFLTSSYKEAMKIALKLINDWNRVGGINWKYWI